jgi:hypothetical protein
MAFSYQGGICFEVFTPQGSKPLPFKATRLKSVRREYDKAIRGTVVTIEGGTVHSKIQLPRDDKASLQLTHPYLVLQLYAPSCQPLYLEFGVTDVESGGKWKLIFSSNIKEISRSARHVKLPLNGIVRDKWLNLCFHIPQLIYENFQQLTLKTTDSIIVSPCRIRKIFTLRDIREGIPVCMDFPAGTNSQSLMFCNNPMESPTCLHSPHFPFSRACMNEFELSQATPEVSATRSLPLTESEDNCVDYSSLAESVKYHPAASPLSGSEQKVTFLLPSWLNPSSSSLFVGVRRNFVINFVPVSLQDRRKGWKSEVRKTQVPLATSGELALA